MSASKIDDPIRDNFSAFIRGMRLGDVPHLVTLLAEDVVFMPPAERTLYGKAEVEEWYKDYFRYFTILQLDETDRSVSPVGNAIVERVAVTVQIEALKGGMPIYDDARLLECLASRAVWFVAALAKHVE